VYAIEGKNFTTGIDLSREVEKALQEVVERIACEVLVNVPSIKKDDCSLSVQAKATVSISRQ
jgi:hypothetical protein